MLNFQTEGKKALVSVDDWFTAPDGNSYKSVWGNVKVINAEAMFGVIPVNCTNIFLQVGEGDKSMLIAGTRVHYMVLSEQKPVVTNNTYIIE